MSSFLWLTWDRAGSLPPSLSIAQELTDRGHHVAFAGRPEMLSRGTQAGFQTIELKSAYEQSDKYPDGPLQQLACYVTSPAVVEETKQLVKSHAPDVVVVDGLFVAGLVNLPEYDRPTAVMVPTFVHRAFDMWRKTVGMLTGAREAAGFGPLPAPEELLGMSDVVISTTLGEFDRPVAPKTPERLVHVGPVLGGHTPASPANLPWDENDGTPLVVVTFTTALDGNAVAQFQQALDALAPLPVHVVATTGGYITPEQLNVPDNAIVLGYAEHDPLFQRASLILTHGGHGTAMRALQHGVPAIFTGAYGAYDQWVMAQTFEEWGCGRAVPGFEDVEALRAAISDILYTPSYHENAQRRAEALRGSNGVRSAADHLETLIPNS